MIKVSTNEVFEIQMAVKTTIGNGKKNTISFQTKPQTYGKNNFSKDLL